MMIQSIHGIYTVQLPLSNGKVASMTGVCLDHITATFHGLPHLPASIGGDATHPGKLRSTMVFPKEAPSALFTSSFTCLNFLSFYPTLVDLSLLKTS